MLQGLAPDCKYINRRNLNRWAIKRKSKQEDMKLGEDGGWRNTFRGVRAED